MFTQLPEEKKDFIKPLYKKHQPNWSALSCYFEGTMPGTNRFTKNISQTGLHSAVILKEKCRAKLMLMM